MVEYEEACAASPLAIQRFNPVIATDYGIPAALIYEHVYTRCQNNGLKEVAATLSMLGRHHPHLGRSALYQGLTTLVKGTLKCPSLLHRQWLCGGYLYSLSDPDLVDNQQQLHLFEVSVATQVGVLPALIYNRVQREHLLHLTGDPWAYPCECRRFVRLCRNRFPYASEKTIRRAVEILAGSGLMQKEEADGHYLWYPCEKAIARN